MSREHRTSRRRLLLRLAGAAGAVVGFGDLPFAARSATDAARKLKIGVIGSGRIGGTLGGLWAKAGHEVMFSSRNLEHDKALATSIGPNARAGPPRRRGLRRSAARGRALQRDAAAREGPLRLAQRQSRDRHVQSDRRTRWRHRDVGARKGAGLASAELLPGAHIVRAFNAVGAARLPHDRAGSG